MVPAKAAENRKHHALRPKGKAGIDLALLP
jgi:hypothetical protein